MARIEPQAALLRGRTKLCVCSNQFVSTDNMCAVCRQHWDAGPRAWTLYVSQQYRRLNGLQWSTLNSFTHSKVCSRCNQAIELTGSKKNRRYCPAPCGGALIKKEQEC